MMRFGGGSGLLVGLQSDCDIREGICQPSEMKGLYRGLRGGWGSFGHQGAVNNRDL